MACAGDFQELDKFSKERIRPPIGFEAFAEVCIDYDNMAEAAKYLAKVTDPTHKVNLHLRMSQYKAAAEAACEADSDELVARVRSKATDPATAHLVNQIFASHGF